MNLDQLSKHCEVNVQGVHNVVLLERCLTTPKQWDIKQFFLHTSYILPEVTRVENCTNIKTVLFTIFSTPFRQQYGERFFIQAHSN